jgi:hypothetical protein
MTLPAEIIAQVRQRANFACEYCGVTETDSGGQLTVDHYRPRTQGGGDELGNMLYCCYRCNLYKGDYWPAKPEDLPLWNPRLDPRENHLLLLADGTLYPISASGRFTLQRLRLNRPELVDYRLLQTAQSNEAAVLQQHKDLLSSLKQLFDRLAETVEEHQILLRTRRAMTTQFFKSNGQQDGPGKSTN